MDDFLELCRRFGHLEELVQAGGGNISVKLSDTLSVIKASGFALSDITREKGYTLFDHTKVQNDQPLDGAVISGPPPSMETYFHVFLRKYVVHVHPTGLLPALCKKQVSNAIPYCKPGADLAKKIQVLWDGGPVILLQNHGVIFTADTVSELMNIAALAYNSYKLPQYIPLREFWKVQDEFPDKYVYKVSLAETRAYLPILTRYNIRNLTPDIALFLHNAIHIEGEYLFICSKSKSKCLAVLEVLRSYCEIADQCENALTEMQVAEILYWPTEQRRLAMP
jgi:ribulose-5-phosphate 4-epimerase/fuculose-1-phosphate aldolase